MKWKLINRTLPDYGTVNDSYSLNLIDETYAMEIRGSMSCLVKHTLRTRNGEVLSSTVLEMRYCKLIKVPDVEHLYELVHINFIDENELREPLPDPLFPITENAG
jgi:hypothetical protein